LVLAGLVSALQHLTQARTIHRGVFLLSVHALVWNLSASHEAYDCPQSFILTAVVDEAISL